MCECVCVSVFVLTNLVLLNCWHFSFSLRFFLCEFFVNKSCFLLFVNVQLTYFLTSSFIFLTYIAFMHLLLLSFIHLFWHFFASFFLIFVETFFNTSMNLSKYLSPCTVNLFQQTTTKNDDSNEVV